MKKATVRRNVSFVSGLPWVYVFSAWKFHHPASAVIAAGSASIEPRLFSPVENEAKREGYTVTVREDRELYTQDNVGLQQMDKVRRGRLVYKKKWGHPTLNGMPPKDFPPILPLLGPNRRRPGYQAYII